jgi:hypothetical protein
MACGHFSDIGFVTGGKRCDFFRLRSSSRLKTLAGGSRRKSRLSPVETELRSEKRPQASFSN